MSDSNSVPNENSETGALPAKNSGSSRVIFVVVGVLVFITLLAGGAFWQWTATTKYTLWRIDRSLKSHDYTTLQGFVEVDALCAAAVEELATMTLDKQFALISEPMNNLEQAGAEQTKKVLAKMKPRLQELAAEQVKQCLGAPGSSTTDSPFTELLKCLAQNQGATFKLAAVEEKGDSAQVRLDLSTTKGRKLNVTFQLSREGRQWKITKTQNLKELLVALAQNK